MSSHLVHQCVCAHLIVHNLAVRCDCVAALRWYGRCLEAIPCCGLEGDQVLRRIAVHDNACLVSGSSHSVSMRGSGPLTNSFRICCDALKRASNQFISLVWILIGEDSFKMMDLLVRFDDVSDSVRGAQHGPMGAARRSTSTIFCISAESSSGARHPHGRVRHHG